MIAFRSLINVIDPMCSYGGAGESLYEGDIGCRVGASELEE